MSLGIESEQEGLHPHRLTETIDIKIVEDAQKIESEQEGLHPQSFTETTNTEIVEDAQTIEFEQESLRPRSLIETIDAKISEGATKTKSLFSSACIYRVLEELRKLNKSVYTPRLIAIGPLHRNDMHLQTPMQHVKTSYTNYLLLRLTKEEPDPKSAKQKRSEVLQECVAEMNRSIDDAKKYYAEEVTLDEEMLLLDGCFILELLYRDYSKASSRTEVDPTFDSILTAKTIKLDLLLFENQIPFFVLKTLFCLTIDKIPNCPKETTLNNLVHAYFGNMMGPEDNSTAMGSAATTINCGSLNDCVVWISSNKMANLNEEEEEEEEEVVSSRGNYNHSSRGNYNDILHKLHKDYGRRHQENKTDLSQLLPSASNLDYAGIKFVSSTEKDPFKVKFGEPKGPFWWYHKASFEIPTLVINDNTEVFLRNMIAFEQCCPRILQYFTSYAYLMDMLVNSKKDIEILEKAGVVHNWLGDSGEATDLFNKLGKETVIGEFFFFGDTCNEAYLYSNRCWPKNMAHLRRTYFASPWTFIAFCLGSIIFGVTIIEFIRNFLK